MLKNNSTNKENKTDNLLTDQFGHAVPDNQNSLTAGIQGPILLQDFVLLNKLSHFNRERIPERVVHAKGTGAFGYFLPTSDTMKKHCKAKMFAEVMKKTPVFVRFSTVTGERGSADTIRDPRGMAIKFYTEDGILDMVCNNFPVFFVRDPMKFPDVIHSLKRNPETGIFRDKNMMWDFFSRTPESVHTVTMLFSDRGTPFGYRHMSAWYNHTLKLVNINGDAIWAKIRFKPELGIKNFNEHEAAAMAGEDSDFSTRDLFEYLDSGKEVVWKMMVQFIPFDQAANYKYDIFDVTKVVLHGDFPEVEVGRLVLNQNPSNHFAEVEQAAFAVSNLVPGIEPSPDKLFQGRLFAYRDTQLYRLGVNYHTIPVNSASLMTNQGVKINNPYLRDGAMLTTDNYKGMVNYEPNSCGGPVELPLVKESAMPVMGASIRAAYQHINDDYSQCRLLYRLVMNDKERASLISNLANSLKYATKEIQIRQMLLFQKVDSSYAQQLAEALDLTKFLPEPEPMISLS